MYTKVKIITSLIIKYVYLIIIFQISFKKIVFETNFLIPIKLTLKFKN